ncbi:MULTISPECIES: PRC and DUF2382 domain-containing protein [Thermomonosporaceae]|uniref:PRC and DUF2382 domain-containing protein n=1 Tax=Thermomonosporaceae TaxID=2012 RepID=UPI00255B3AFC|nr:MULTISPECIES: PRC and DUF2382 domain-containing protein [Thermomonosporaceae]MDL4775461.1 PRC and DUF2382 domain-containing protein [Actinomadura xylanilytica]
MQTQMRVQDLMGSAVTDSNGSRVGTIKQVYLNDASGAPEWVTVHTGWFGMRESFLPLSGSNKSGETLQVPYDKDTIKDAPNVDADEHLSHDQIVDLYRHYGVRPPSGSAPDTGRSDSAGEAAAGGAAGGAAGRTGMGAPSDKAATGSAATGGTGTAGTGKTATGKASSRGQEARSQTMGRMDEGMSTTEMTRSEEQMRVGTEQHETGRAHIRKWVETEQVERTVPVAHEELRIEREPVTGDAARGKVSISEDDLEVVLHEERPVIAKETVAVERIRVSTDRVEEQETVRGEVRKEHVEVTQDEDTPGKGGGKPSPGGS